MKGNRYFFKVFALITEFVIIQFSCRLAYFLRYGDFGPYQDYYLSFFIIFNLAWIGASLFTNSYDRANLLSLRAFVRNLFSTLFLHIFIVFLFIVSVKAQYLSRLYIFYTYSASLMTIMSYRAILILTYKYYNSVNYNLRKIALVGSRACMEDLTTFFDQNHTSVHTFLEDLDTQKSYTQQQDEIRMAIDELKSFCLEEKVDEVYVSLRIMSEDMLEELTDFADDHFIYFRMVTDFQVLQKKKLNVDFYEHIPIISLRKEPLRSLINQVMKRGFDIAFSLLILMFVLPILFPLIAIAIALESKGPVIFRQLRSGKNNREFWCYKFRTMVQNPEADYRQASKNDDRITRIGAFLRKTSLDELPQFVNVLKGNMSVVGPRPHMIQHTQEYSNMIDKYLNRHFITPGITGHAQVNGLRGETADPNLMKKRVEYDAWYIENWSLMLDIKIVFLTIWNLLRGQEQAY
ncbi:MAG: undecaprenyl-phosphate glucose phosphotransferase [Bacteroidota bacterium]